MYLCPTCRTPSDGPTCGTGGHRTTPVPGLEGWTIDQKIHSGGQGTVFKVRDPHQNAFAIKLFDTRHLDEDPQHQNARRSWRREVRALSTLTHDHVVALVTSAEVGDQVLLVTEFIPHTLEPIKAPIPLPRAVRLAAELADALTYVHDRDLTHGDINPRNIGLDGRDRIRLFDFGLARRTGDTSTMVGRQYTERYAAPEQLKGHPASPQSDLFSFGVVLYELLTARRYRVSALVEPKPVFDPTWPEALRHLLERLLEPDPHQRLQAAWQAQDLLAELSDALGAGIEAARQERKVLTADVAELGRQRQALISELARLKTQRSETEHAIQTARQQLEAEAREAEVTRRQHETHWLAARQKTEAQAAEASRAATTRLEALQRSLEALSKQEAETRDTLARLHRQLPDLEAEIGQRTEALGGLERNERRRRLLPIAAVAGPIVGLVVGWMVFGGDATEDQPVHASVETQPVAPVTAPPTAPETAPRTAPPAAPRTAPPTAPPTEVANAAPIEKHCEGGTLASAATDHRPALCATQAGTFTMGSPENEPGRSDNEKQHPVTLTRHLWVMETEVTRAQWTAVMGTDPSYFKRADDLPVERVSWYDAVTFANKLSKMEGLSACYALSACKEEANLGQGCAQNEAYCDSKYTCEVKRIDGCAGYRLPTEAEWEYLARAGTTTATYAADVTTIAWFDENSHETQPVGQKAANPWGLRDMLGNVWEWCEDWYDAYPQTSIPDPVGPPTGDHRVVRGGSWGAVARWVRAAYRDYVFPVRRLLGFGFRLVRAPSS